MSNAFLSLTSYIVNAIWQLPLIGAAGWCLSRWLKQTGSELPHKIWVAVLILATIAPATPVLQRYFAHETPTGIVAVSPRPALAPVSSRDAAPTGFQVVLQPAVIYVVSGLYLAALVFFSLRLCWLLRCTSALIRNGGPLPMDPESAATWDRSRERFFLKAAPLLCSGDVPGPLTAGLLRPVIVLPASFVEQHTRTEFLAALGHECAHIERNDFRKNLFYEAVALVTAFHPLTWLVKSQIAQTREMICDRIAAERLMDRRTYGSSLLQLAARMPSAACPAISCTVGMFDTNSLERRIMTLMTSVPRVNKIRRYCFGVTAMLILFVCACVSGLFTQSVTAQTSTSSAQASSAAKTQQESKDLTCTYYDGGVGSEGTCGYDKKDKTKYRCYSNQDSAKSQDQIGCEWKVKRAEAAKKK